MVHTRACVGVPRALNRYYKARVCLKLSVAASDAVVIKSSIVTVIVMLSLWVAAM